MELKGFMSMYIYICIRTEKQKLSKKEIQIHVEQTSESLDVYLFDKILKRRLS